MEALLRQVARAHGQKPLNALFTYFCSAFARPEVIREVSDMGIITVNRYCNASYQFDLVCEIAPAYSYCLVPAMVPERAIPSKPQVQWTIRLSGLRP